MSSTNSRILGTRIEAAADEDRERSLLVADLHIPESGGLPMQQLQLLVEEAKSEASATRLFILGDLFDVYLGPRQLRGGIWAEVASLLRAAAETGLSITLLWGNRDYMLDGAFGCLAGSRVVGGGLELELGGRRTLLLHGDELCLEDRPYQRAKRWLRNPLTRTMLRHLPGTLTAWLGRRARLRSQRVIAGGDPRRFAPAKRALEEVFAHGYEFLVFGHVHAAARGTHAIVGACGGCGACGACGEYAILPAFESGGIHLEGVGGQLRYRDLQGHYLPDYPPWEFL